MYDIMLINDAIKKHRELSEYYDAMGCKDEVIIQDHYIRWLTELREYKANDAEPVKHGHWIIIDDVEKFLAKCSECGRVEDTRLIENYPYCHCGAKMEKVKW